MAKEKIIYQVNEKHFYISHNTDYLSAVSPFHKELAYKNKKNALAVFNSLIEDYRNDAHTINEQKYGADIIQFIMSNKRVVISIDYITLK